MRTSAQILLWSVVVLSCTAQQKSWQELDAQSMILHQQGRYSEAAKVTEEALTVAENTFGPNHAKVAKSLHDLGSLHRAQGKYAEAGPLCKRVLETGEKPLVLTIPRWRNP